MAELTQLLKALYGVYTAPWFPVLLLGIAVLLGVWRKRGAIAGYAKAAYGKLSGAAKGRVKLPQLSAVHVLLAVAALSLVSQRGCVLPEIKWPSMPSIPDILAPGPVAPDAPALTFKGKHVIVVHESGDTTRGLAMALTSMPSVQTYLNSHCDGGALGWRLWDHEVPLTNAPANLKEMMSFTQPAMPAVNIAVGGRLVQAELPKAEAEFLALLTKYLGP